MQMLLTADNDLTTGDIDNDSPLIPATVDTCATSCAEHLLRPAANELFGATLELSAVASELPIEQAHRLMRAITQVDGAISLLRIEIFGHFGRTALVS